MAPDIYEKLAGPDPIRLVFIAPGAFDDDISCILIPATVKFEHEYLALSYVWGDPTKKVPITVNNQAFPVTINLDAAIRRIRNEENYVLYWIDAICINQADVDERNQQVKIMRHIYSSASLVIIYAREAIEGTDDGIKLIQMIDVIADDINPDPAKPYILLEGSIQESALPAPDSPQWDHFQDFFRRAWFSRIWVLQEVAMASRDPIIICGENKLFWSTVSKVARFFHQTGVVMSRPIKDRSYNAIVMSWCRETETAFPLWKLLKWTQRFEATDPRDKLFALYGLAADMTGPGENAGFEIDYSKPASEIYRPFVSGHIHFHGSPDILIDVDQSRKGKIEGLPSWVPDWTAPPEAHPFRIDGTSEPYHSSAGFNALVTSQASNQDVLRIAASLHDEIVWVSDPFDDEDFDILPPFRRPGQLMRIWNEICNLLNTSFHSDSIVEEFWRTLIANVDKYKQPVDGAFYINFLSYWRLARLADQAAKEYVAEHPDRPAYDDYETRKKVKHEFDEARVLSEEWFSAFQRFTDKILSEAGVSCTNTAQAKESDCKHCRARNNPELAFRQRFHPVKGKDPALEFEDTDPFIKDYFYRLKNDVYQPTPIVAGDANDFANTFLQSCARRAFFVTKRGLLGVGPRTTRPADKVAILSGGSMPFVIRETNVISTEENLSAALDISFYKRYNLVGPSYVHKLMNGEGLVQLDLGTHQWTMIDLI